MLFEKMKAFCLPSNRFWWFWACWKATDLYFSKELSKKKCGLFIATCQRNTWHHPVHFEHHGEMLIEKMQAFCIPVNRFWLFKACWKATDLYFSKELTIDGCALVTSTDAFHARSLISGTERTPLSGTRHYSDVWFHLKVHVAKDGTIRLQIPHIFFQKGYSSRRYIRNRLKTCFLEVTFTKASNKKD